MAWHVSSPARARRGTAAALALLMLGTVLVAGAGAATVECGDVIAEDTILTSDIGPCPGEGLVVATDGITLDLGGHSITGDATARADQEMVGDTRDKAGILLRGVRGVTVTNGSVSGFDAGVAVMGGGGNHIYRVTARDNINYRIVTGEDASPDEVDPDEGPFCWFGDGITLFNSSGNVVERNTLARNGPFSGASIVGDSNDNVLAHNDVRDNDLFNHTPDGDPTICGGLGAPQQPMQTGRVSQDVGLRLEGPGADRNIVEHNKVRRSGLAGIFLHGYQVGVGANNGSNIIRKNNIMLTGLRTHDSTFDGAESYKSSGIQVHHAGTAVVHISHGNVIEDNVSSRNFGAGIEVTGPTPGSGRSGEHGNTIRNNVVNNNGLDGIHLAEGTVETVVTGNRGHGNARDAERVAEISEADPYSEWDGVDGGDYSTGCGSNTWSRNRFGTVNQECVAARGTGKVRRAGKSG